MNDDQLTKAFARYQHTKKVGSLLFLAGQGCREPSTDKCIGLTRDESGRIIAYDIVEQTTGVLKNIERALSVHKLNRSHLADVTVFLNDMKDFEKMNQVWNTFFEDCEPPTRTTIAVSKLPGDNFVEMKAIAVFPEG